MDQKQFFFSIVIPAHNEENYITKTLSNIKKLNYPADKFETIVIENGSTDKTLEIAREMEDKNMFILSSSEKGVSKARNLGATKINPSSDWTVFLDADTILKPEFLNDLNIYLQNNVTKNYVIGTTELQPLPESKTAKRWFTFYDIGHKLFEVSYSIQVVKTSLLKDIKYDETMSMGEDLKFIKDAKKFGKFFFLQTKTVGTSTRRFEQVGWWKLFFQWNFVANLPLFLQKKFDYKVTR